MYVCMHVQLCMYACMYNYVCMHACTIMYVCMHVLTAAAEENVCKVRNVVQGIVVGDDYAVLVLFVYVCMYVYVHVCMDCGR